MKSISLKKIGQVAKILGTTTRTLRFYEDEGLVVACRTPGGTRLYSEENIIRFKGILFLVKAGLPLSLIKKLILVRETCETGAESSRKVISIIEELTKQIKTQINLLVYLEKELLFTVDTIEKCLNCNNPPTRKGCPHCPVNKNSQFSEILNLIWEQKTV